METIKIPLTDYNNLLEIKQKFIKIKNEFETFDEGINEIFEDEVLNMEDKDFLTKKESLKTMDFLKQQI